MKLSFTFFISIFLATFSISAQPAVFERITIEDGLSQGMLFDVLQTRDGFLWMA